MKALAAACTFFVLSAIQGAYADEDKSLFDKKTGSLKNAMLESLLVDSSAGSVSAAGLAGVDTEVLSVIENVRDFSLLLNALDKNSQAIGIAITPARTTRPFPPIDLQKYAQKDAFFTRLLGSMTLSYAQGKTDINGTNFTRTAYAIATSAYFDPNDDPAVAVANATQCSERVFALLNDKPTITDEEVKRRVAEREKLEAQALAGDQDAKDKMKVNDVKGTRVAADEEKVALDAFNTCVTEVLDNHSKKWNRSRYSISYAAGSVKPTDGGGSSVKLGKTLALSVLYGFDGIDTLKDSAAFTLTARRSIDEPVLETLGTGDVKSKNTSLYAARLAGGSSVFRGIAEVSNSSSSGEEITFLQRTFRRALGIDYRIAKGVWLNLRYGKQRKVDGDGDEDASLLTLNWSPSALLQGR